MASITCLTAATVSRQITRLAHLIGLAVAAALNRVLGIIILMVSTLSAKTLLADSTRTSMKFHAYIQLGR